MTDYELNRAVAEARGWTGQEEETWWPNTEFIWRDAKGYKVNDLFDVVNDPAAWGAFLLWLAKEKWCPRIVSPVESGEYWQVYLYGESRYFAEDVLLGRALALAFLKSRGVSV